MSVLSHLGLAATKRSKTNKDGNNCDDENGLNSIMAFIELRTCELDFQNIYASNNKIIDVHQLS